MRQFKPWKNNLENDATKMKEVERMITKVEYKNQDRYEKTIRTMAFQTEMQVTKGYEDRKKMKSFGIGNTFDDLKMNSVVSTVQRENVWHPYYELNLETEMTFTEQLKSNMDKRAADDIEGKEMKEIKAKLDLANQKIQMEAENRKRKEEGLPPKKTGYNIQEKLKQLAEKEEEDANAQVIDPWTVKIRKIQEDMQESELLDIMSKFGEVTRVRIPRDDNGRTKGIAFASYKKPEDCTKVAEEGAVRYDFYELPVE